MAVKRRARDLVIPRPARDELLEWLLAATRETERGDAEAEQADHAGLGHVLRVAELDIVAAAVAVRQVVPVPALELGVILAARHPETVRAMISAGGRPDLAGSAMARVWAPSLFIVGGEDPVGLGFTRLMLEIFPRGVASKLEILRGVGLRFEEGPVAARAAELAIAWLEDHLPRRAQSEQAA